MERDNEENGRGEREDTSTDGKMRPEEENCGRLRHPGKALAEQTAVQQGCGLPVDEGREPVVKDFAHKVSSDISKSHVVVVVEDLRVKNMSKSATKRVAQKSGLNRSLLDASPFELRRQQ